MGRVVTVLGVVLALASAAGAQTMHGTPRSDRLAGTPGADALFGRAGADRLVGRAGNDLLHGGDGADALDGGPGSDRISVEADGARDRVACGPGRDTVTAELRDRVPAACEVVSRQLSRDDERRSKAQHETQVEPDSFAFGRTVVTTFQSGRFLDGGAARIGWATSFDAGRTWRSGFLPGVGAHVQPPGSTARASDPVVAYDAVNGTWLIATLGVTPGRRTELLVSRSADGSAWEPPVVAARVESQELAHDKEWIVCDNWPSSPFRGSCYLSYSSTQTGDPATHSLLATQVSRDGGRSWSPPLILPRRASFVLGVQPVVRPDGTLVTVYLDEDGLAAVRSTDGGASFSPPSRVASVRFRGVAGFRAPELPAVDVDSLGRVYAVWPDCRFRRRCVGSDVALATSDDGSTWSAVRRVPVRARTTPVTHFLPTVAAETVQGSRRLAVLYYVTRAGCVSCGVDVELTASADGGQTWRRPTRLTARPMRPAWVARSARGRMLADYVSVSFAGSRIVPVFTLASEPAGPRFRQATFAASLP